MYFLIFNVQMDIMVNYDSIFNMFKLVSVPNRHLIRLLLIYDCADYSELHFNLVRLFRLLYDVPIEYYSFSYVLNDCVTSYLKYVIDKSLNSSVLKYHLLGYPANIEHDVRGIILNGLRNCYQHNFHIMNCPPTIRIETDGFNIPVEIYDKSENVESAEKEKYMENKTVVVDSDFQSFLLPLEQDYTKSSKGYCSHSTFVNNKIKDENTCNIVDKDKYLQASKIINFENSVLEKYKTNYQIQKGFCQYSDDAISNELKSKSNNGILNDSHVFHLQDVGIDTQERSSQNYSKNSHNEVFNYSFKADRVKQELDCDVIKEEKYIGKNDDSDSDNSIESSEDSVDERCSATSFDNLLHCYESDSDDSIIFSENFEKVQVGNGASIKFCDKLNLDNSSSEDDCEESESGLFGTFDCNFQRNYFPRISSSFQNKMQNVNKYLSTSYTAYTNPCFEDNDDIFDFNHITSINTEWNDKMKDISSEPRQAKRVSFVPLPDLESVHMFEPDNDGYRYSLYVLDQLHFQNRIKEFETIIAPYLTSEHRAKIYQQSYHCKI